jgi:phage terminase small subunit
MSEQAKTKPIEARAKPKHTIGAKDAGGLTPNQRKFVTEYLKDGNATQAAIRAGYAKGSAGQIAAKLLKIAKLKAEIELGQAKVIEKIQADTGITLERTLRELARLAFFDPRKLFDAQGNPIPIQELDDDTAASVSGLDVTEEFEGTGRERVFVGHTKKYKLADKRASIDMLMKHLGGYKEDNKQSGEAAAGTVTAMLASMKKSALGVLKNVPDDDE